jgi:DNA-binding winged helix-turn-helix (wHTH) protein
MSSNRVHGTLRFGPFELSRSKRALRRNGVTLSLGARAFEILVYLAERPGEVIGKKELIDHVWPNVTVDEGSLRVHVAAIRKALGDGQFGNRYIANVKGRGYAFIGSVIRLVDSPEHVGNTPPPENNQMHRLVFVLEALNALGDRVHTTEMEDDGYVTKPFALAELVARMETLLRWPPDMRETNLRVGVQKLRRH